MPIMWRGTSAALMVVASVGCERPLPPALGADIPDLAFPVLHPGPTSYRPDEKVKLSDFEGRVLVLDVWASWCSPCRGRHEILASLHPEIDPEQVMIVGVQFNDLAEITGDAVFAGDQTGEVSDAQGAVATTATVEYHGKVYVPDGAH